MKIKHDLSRLNNYVDSLATPSLKILHHSLSEIKASKEIKPNGSLRVPYSPQTESGIHMLIDNNFFGETSKWINQYFSDDYFYFDLDEETIKNLYTLFEITTKKIEDLGISANLYQKANRIEINGLLINLSEGKIKYDLGKEIRITPTSQEIKLLVYLIEKQNTIVRYKELAKQLGIKIEEGGYFDKDLARTIQLIKKNLVSLLKSVGMSEKDTRDFIRCERSNGLILYRTS